MSGQQYMQALQQSPYYQQVQNSPYVMPQQLPMQPSNWGQMARQGMSAPLASEVAKQQQIAAAKSRQSGYDSATGQQRITWRDS
jgi:hypothetical protein